MGTRSSTGFIVNGTYAASYNQYDGYPEGVGANIAKEVAVFRQDVAAWRERAAAVRLVDEDAAPTAKDRKLYKKFWENVSTGKDWYSLLRGQQGGIKDRIEAGVMTDSRGFVKDSLFCEYAYVVDFDREVLILLEGFNQSASKQAPYPWCRVSKAEAYEAHGGGRYYGCRLVAELPFAKVSPEAVKAAYEGKLEDALPAPDLPKVAKPAKPRRLSAPAAA